jgi:hypothetical protein
MVFIAMIYSNEQLIQFIKDYNKSHQKIPSSGSFRSFGFPDGTIYKRRFGSWNAAIELAGLKCRSKCHSKIEVICALCEKEISVRISQRQKSKSGLSFCSRSCSASYQNAFRVMSDETKEKISQALKKAKTSTEKNSSCCTQCRNSFLYSMRYTFRVQS